MKNATIACSFVFVLMLCAEMKGNLVELKLPVNADKAEWYIRHNRYAEAITCYKAAEAAVDSDHIEVHAYLKACLALAYWQNCQWKEAIQSMNVCQSLMKESRPKTETLLILSEYLILSEQHTDLAELYLNHAATILKNQHAGQGVFGKLYFLKGFLNYTKNDYENALQFFNQSLRITSGDESLIKYRIGAMRYMAAIYYDFEDNYRKSLDSCLASLTVVNDSKQSPAYFYLLMGFCYKKLNEPVLAHKYFEKTVRLSQTFRSAMDYKSYSQAYYQLSKFENISDEEKVHYLTLSLDAARQVAPKGNEVSKINRRIGLYYYNKGSYYQTLKYVQQAIIAGSYSFSDTSVLKNPAAEDIQPWYSMIETLSLKANALVRIDTNNLCYLESALECTELGAQLIQRRVSDIDEENSGISVTDSRKRTMNNAVSYASRLYELTGMRIYAEKALAYAEKSKMQVLFINTYRENKLRRTDIPDSLLQKEKKLNNRILELENRMALYKRNGISSEIADVTTQITDLYNERDAFELYMREKHPASFNAQYDIALAGISEIQKMTATDQLIIEYQLLKSQIIIFVLTREKFHIRRVLIDDEILQHIETLRDVISTRPSSDNAHEAYRQFTVSSYFLYKKLIQPIEILINKKRLLIIPHNELTLVPFELLISGIPSTSSADYRALPYLIKRYPVSYAYSANFLLDQGKSLKYGSGTAVFLPDYRSFKSDNFFEALAGADEEARYVKKISGGTLYKGKTATESIFKKNASQYRVLHIASHTIIDEELPNLSCLLMTQLDTSDDAHLYAYEVKQLDLHAQLVVLSGCNTGYGKLKMSEGLLSLARSFFYTGVRTVAFTLWPVADQSGSEVVYGFYNGLRKHHTLDVSLRNAKLSFLSAADPVKTHPYYWANYMIVGKTDDVPFRKFPVWLTGSSVLLLMVSVWFFIKKIRS